MASPVPIDRRSWRDRLQHSTTGATKPNLFNGCIALRDHPDIAGRIAYDEFGDRTYVRGALPWDARVNRPWSPFDDLAAAEWIQAQDVPVGTKTAAEAVERVAYESRFHPVLEYLESLKWDGTERLNNWLTYYMGVPLSPLVAAIGRKFLISAVARVYKPGCKVDHMLILEGQQGLMKSTALRTLAGEEWFADQIADLGTKDSSQDLRGKWLIELSELSAIKANETERVKAYVSRQTDHYRPSFGRRSVDIPRQTVFIGTTNAAEYLSDTTGNRRYWPVLCTNMDIEALANDRSQLWAEAVVAYHAGESWWLEDDDLRAAAQKEQEERRIADPWESYIEDWLADPTRVAHDGVRLPIKLDGCVTTAQLLEHAICKPTERQTTADMMRCGRILKGLGWRKRKRGNANRVQWIAPGHE